MSSLALYVLFFLVSPVTCSLCTTTNIDLVARIVFGEARSETNAGQLAVAYTVVNRVNTPGFPKTVPDVLNQKYNNGRQHQYITLDNKIHELLWQEDKGYNTVAYQRAVNAATYALCGTKPDPTTGATFFCIQYKCTKKFENMYFVVKKEIRIGYHYFPIMGPR
ncbi:hypothetical protein ACJMK2_026059 [Sinanodonta woodiana]|uniref:Cell wall hydrolase SleB domain-containing protein n=1 Tax=Sinanodonta woodiana TaxID=1069815 RepID=A0ABD3XK74_SINWO